MGLIVTSGTWLTFGLSGWSMLCGLMPEAPPFELAAACPPEHKLAHGGKGVLKQAARGLLPDEVIDRPKGYFPVPLLSHLAGPVLDYVTDALTTEGSPGLSGGL